MLSFFPYVVLGIVEVHNSMKMMSCSSTVVAAMRPLIMQFRLQCETNIAFAQNLAACVRPVLLIELI